ncbi:hypothetical protein ACH42_17185 [Endozoicomonas sp. (ex Bugula neritina AB1)]|nr:hypothetical protein ACH42_17185 [Endozoicomonas sp. (ex Bugula neritina AB1)]
MYAVQKPNPKIIARECDARTAAERFNKHIAQYPGDDPLEIYMLLGILPQWINASNPLPYKEQLENGFLFPVEWTEQNIKDTGEFLYPNDPPLWPVAKTERNHETVFFYPHSFVGIITPEKRIMARLD